MQSFKLAFTNMFAHAWAAWAACTNGDSFCKSAAALVQSEINSFDPAIMAKRHGPPPIFRKPRILIHKLLKVPAAAAKSWSDYKPLYWSKNVRDRHRDRAMRLSFSTSWI